MPKRVFVPLNSARLEQTAQSTFPMLGLLGLYFVRRTATLDSLTSRAAAFHQLSYRF